jgi:hypothetical protein
VVVSETFSVAVAMQEVSLFFEEGA